VSSIGTGKQYDEEFKKQAIKLSFPLHKFPTSANNITAILKKQRRS